jgi:hypothetical protein
MKLSAGQSIFKPTAVQGIVIALAFLAMANCLKHVVRQNAWGTLAFELIKDLSVGIGTFYLYKKSHEEKNAALSPQLLLIASMVGDWAAVLMPR